MYGVKVIFILYLVSDYIGVKRFWERWVRVKERTCQASPKMEERKRLGSTLVEALAASLEQHSPPNQYRCSCSNPDNKLCFHSPTRGVSEDSKQEPGKGRQVLRSQLCKPGEADKIPKRTVSRIPKIPKRTVSRFQELDSVPAQGTAAVWAGEEQELGRDEVMLFDRDEDD